MERVEIRTQGRAGVVEVTRRVEEVVARSGVQRGVAVVCSLHTTAGVTINENADPDVMEDVMAALERMAPRGASYAHVEGNADAHIKASLVGLSVTVPVEGGKLVLGRWQGIFFCEFDGPRRRVVGVQAVGGSDRSDAETQRRGGTQRTTKPPRPEGPRGRCQGDTGVISQACQAQRE